MEYASGSASPFGAKLRGNISSGADINAEGALGVRRAGSSLKFNAFGNIGASAALLRAQGEVGYDFKLGPLTLTPKAGGEVQALGLGATAGGGYRSFETRSGGQVFVTAGATPVLVGGKVKFSLSWDWDPKWKWTPMKALAIKLRSKRQSLLVVLATLALTSAQAAPSAAECAARHRPPDLVNAPLAIEALRRIELREPECLGTGMFDVNLADEYLLAGDTASATRVVERALTRRNNVRPNLLHMQVRINLKLGKIDEAVRGGEAIAADYPEYAPIQAELAGIATKRQDWPRALKHARRGFEIEGSALSLLSMATALHQLDRHEECIAAVRQALKLEPQRIARVGGLLEGIYSLGVLNRRAEAAELVRRHIAANPNWRANAAFVAAAEALGVK